ncbi:hypothetical protein Ancab_006696, partial [Ancistrocladus abbreviatus]
SPIGESIVEKTAVSWLDICPMGIYNLVNYVKCKYNNPPIFILENGMADARNDAVPLEAALKDSRRIRYYEGYLSCLLEAI